jgi:hypothetical protein
MKFSPAQQKMLDEIHAKGLSQCSSFGRPDSGRRHSAWHRTAKSLAAKGLVVVERASAYAFRAVLPHA